MLLWTNHQDTMKKRTIPLHCDTKTAAFIYDAVSTYANAAYPPGGSDCAQVAKDALLTAVRQYKQQVSIDSTGSISSKQRSMWKTAIRWYICDINSDQFANPEQAAEKLLTIFKGNNINFEQLTHDL